MGSQGAPLNFTLSGLKGHIQCHSDVESVAHEAAELGHSFLLNTNRKSYMESPNALLDRIF